MTPEVASYLAKARSDYTEAQIIADVGLAKAAARSAYYAAFHCAEALVLARTGRIAKTHSGLRAAFARLTLTEPAVSRVHVAFLSESYKFKEIGDYGIGDDAMVSMDEAQDLIVRCGRFLDEISALLVDP